MKTGVETDLCLLNESNTCRKTIEKWLIDIDVRRFYAKNDDKSSESTYLKIGVPQLSKGEKDWETDLEF